MPGKWYSNSYFYCTLILSKEGVMWTFSKSRVIIISGMVGVMIIKLIMGNKKENDVILKKKGRSTTFITKGDNMELTSDFMSDYDDK